VLSGGVGFFTLRFIAPLRPDRWTENWFDTNSALRRAFAMGQQKAREDHGQYLSDSQEQAQQEKSRENTCSNCKNRAASSAPPQGILCRNAGFSRQILTIPVPLPHECGVPGGLDAALLQKGPGFRPVLG